MSKIVQMILSGMFFTFIIDFFLFLGIKENYIDAYNIKVYYNVLFADHQNFFVFIFFTFLLGYLVMYTSPKISITTIGLLFILSAATLIAPVGKFAGELLLMKKDVIVKTKKFSYHGDIIYDGRKELSIYDYELKKVIILDKNKIVSEY
ncbi:MAG: hypothetical protein ABGW85_08485 [Sulfurimonas sp.]